KSITQTAKAAFGSVKNQQNVVFIADSSQPLEIAYRGWQNVYCADRGFDDHRCDRRAVMRGDDTFELVGEMRPKFRLALGKGLLVAIIGRRKMIDAGQTGAEDFPVCGNAARPPCRQSPVRDRRTAAR